jgi:DNA (cytosine-5)-methyltransferase 1
MKLKILDLFSGLGGFSLGLERTGQFKTVAFCEIDKYCTLLLKKHWKGTKIYNDVKEITKEKFITDGIQLPDIITGGFPCQPFSVAGKQKGTSDDRHLWPEMFRIIKEFTPRWVVGENVKGITNIQDGMVFETVCTDLEGAGYEVRTFNIPAAGVGAPHRRERMWIVAHAKRFNEIKPIRGSNETQRGIQEEHRQDDSSPRESSRTSSVRQSDNGHEDVENSRRTIRGEQSSRHQESIGPGTSEKTEWSTDSDSITRSSEGETIMADTDEGRSYEQEHKIQTGRNIASPSGEDVADTKSSSGNVNEAVAGNGGSTTQEVSGDGSSVRGESAWWDFEPDVGRVAHGIPGRVYRLKGLGNSIISQIAQEIGNAIIKAERQE